MHSYLSYSGLFKVTIKYVKMYPSWTESFKNETYLRVMTVMSIPKAVKAAGLNLVSHVLTGSHVLSAHCVPYDFPSEGLWPEEVALTSSEYVLKIRQRLERDAAAREQREKRRRQALVRQLQAHEEHQVAKGFSLSMLA